ncbi:MAG: hypothetical protein WCH99_04995 [Verrucomicrobiota bacterium]
MNFADAKKFHFRRLRELEARLLSCQTHEQEENVQKLIEAENARWATLQQTKETKPE